jgi:hypothetical protein
MLQSVHQKNACPRASSIHCPWIRSEKGVGSPLVTVWVDNEMRGFWREFVSDPGIEFLTESKLDEPGGAPVFRMLRQPTAESTLYL